MANSIKEKADKNIKNRYAVSLNYLVKHPCLTFIYVCILEFLVTFQVIVHRNPVCAVYHLMMNSSSQGIMLI